MSTSSVPTPRRARTAILLILLVAGVFLAGPAVTHARAALLLMRVGDPSPPSGLRCIGVVPVDESTATFAAPEVAGKSIEARLYLPHGAKDPPGLVLLHGVHHLGIDEPRLVRFARSIAASGIAVLTPELRDLADYRVDPRSILAIEAAARELRARTAAGRTVGLMGMSFAGGLALLAAADPDGGKDIDYVVSVGAHDDLERVSRFFVTNTIERPDGTTSSLHAHEYGPLVFVYAHAEDFFGAPDVAGARDALRSWLWEERDAARAKASLLSSASQAKITLLFEHHVDALAPELLRSIDESRPALAAVSPHGHLGTVHVPVYVLHGADDSVIPASEALWLAADLPKGVLREVLVTRAIGHVELGDKASWAEKWSVVHFLAQVLAEAAAPKTGPG